jgi:hypothetical protein
MIVLPVGYATSTPRLLPLNSEEEADEIVATRQAERAQFKAV